MEANKRKRDDSDDAGLARITYHADIRAFERLLKERSLDELKNTVKRKLGLESGAVVKLKQIRSGMLLDLDDDDDFEALRVQASRNTLFAIDIKVTVEERGSQPSTTLASDALQSSTVSSTSAKPTTKKRKVSFGDGDSTSASNVAPSGTLAGPEPPKQPTRTQGKKRKAVLKDTTSTDVPTLALPPEETEGTLPPPATKASNVGAGAGAGEPPKKKHKRAKDAASAPNGESSKAGERSQAGESSRSSEVLNTHDDALEKVQETGKTTEGVSVEAVPLLPKKKTLKSSKSKDQAEKESEIAGSSTVPSEEQPSTSGKAKEGKKSTRKDDSKAPNVLKKPENSKKVATRGPPGLSTIAPADGRDDSDAAGTSSLALKKPSKKKLTGQGGVGRLEKERSSNRKDSQVANERSTMVNPTRSNPSLLDADSWGDFLESFKLGIAQLQNDKGDSFVEAETTKKPKRSNKPKKAATPPTHEPHRTSIEPSVPDNCDSSSSGQGRKSPSTSQPCPICLEWPFHVRYDCPIVLQGSNAIQKRLDELRQSNSHSHDHLIEELEGLLQRCKGSDMSSTTPNASSPSSPPSVTMAVLPSETLIPPDSPVTRSPSLPDKDESSSETSTDEDEKDEVEQAPLKPSRTNKKAVSYGNNDLEAVIRGPAPNRGMSNILRELREEEERETVQLEEDEEDGPGERSHRRLSHRVTHPSDEEEEEDSQSPPADLTGPQMRRCSDESETRLGRKVVGDVTGNARKTASGIPVVSKTVSCDKAGDLAKDRSNIACGHHADDDVDPIEPAEELAYSSDIGLPETDPIEPGTPAFNKAEIMFTAMSHSTPKLSVRTRSRGVPPADDDEQPVPISLVSEGRETITSLVWDKKFRKKTAGISASQEIVGTRKMHTPEPLPSTEPIAAPVNGKRKAAVKKGKVSKTPAKPSQQALKMNGIVETEVEAMGHTPSLAMWETIPEGTPSVQLDELVSGSSQVEGGILAPVNKPSDMAASRLGDDSHDSQEESNPKPRVRLFDLTASQIPFPYSQYTTPQGPAAPSSDSDREQEEAQKLPERPVRKSATHGYRPLTELASEASSLFSPSLPTPGGAAGGKNGQKKSAGDYDDSDEDSSSSSQSDHVAASTHIPKGKRASSMLSKRKRGLLAGL